MLHGHFDVHFLHCLMEIGEITGDFVFNTDECTVFNGCLSSLCSSKYILMFNISATLFPNAFIILKITTLKILSKNLSTNGDD